MSVVVGLAGLLRVIDKRDTFLGVPHEGPQASKRFGRGALAIQDIVVDHKRLPVARFDGDHREAKFGDTIFDHTMLELNELVSGMGRLTKRYDAGIPYNCLQEVEILGIAAGGVGAAEALSGMSADV